MLLQLLLAATFALPQDQTKLTVHPPPTIEERIAAIADTHKVNRERLLGTLKCESNFKTDAVGDNGTSYGIAQIHLPSHPEITKEQALDAEFSIDFAASEFAKGNAKKWTCWRKLYRK